MLIGCARALYGRWQFRRLIARAVAGVVMVAMLAFVTALMACAVLLGGLYAAYALLVQHGMSAEGAGMIVAAAAVAATVAFAYATRQRLLYLREVPQMGGSLPVSQLTEAVDAFFDGLLGDKGP